MWAPAGGTYCLAAAAPAAFDLAADQGASGGTEDGAGSPLAMGIDRTTDQRAAGGADDQAGGAIGPLAAQATLRIAPGLAVIGSAVRHRGRRHDGDGEGRGSECHQYGTQRKFLGFVGFLSARFQTTCMNVT